MLKTATVLGLFGLVLLLAAIVSWVRLLDGPVSQRLDGQLALNPRAEPASRLLTLTLGLSAVAAILALVARFVP